MRAALLASLLVAVGLLSAEVEAWAGANPSVQKPSRQMDQTPHLSIPRLHLSVAVRNHQDLGPAWWPSVPNRPGEGSTVAVAGHRTTHGGPFRYLDQLRAGDTIRLRWDGRWHRYRVTGSRVRPASDVHIADLRPREWLILTTCTQPNRQPTSASYRLVVYALNVKEPSNGRLSDYDETQ